MTNSALPLEEHEVRKNIIVAVILCILTFGIYALFWQYHQMKVYNRLLGEEKYGFWKWFLLTIITFGLYHIYHEYVMGEDMMRIQEKYGFHKSESLPLVSVLLAIFGLPIVADAIQQYELHQLYAPKLTLPEHAPS